MTQDLSLTIINIFYCFYDFNIPNDLKICSDVILEEARWPNNV